FGLLTSLTSSIPQFAELYRRFRKSPEPAWKLFQHNKGSLGDTWRSYRRLRESFGEPRFITVPTDVREAAAVLSRGGLTPVETWTETIRIWFGSGAEGVAWIRDCGYLHPPSL